MLYVKTRIGPSKIHGIGLFANQFIEKGTVLWKFTPGFDLKFTKKEIKKFPKKIQGYLRPYMWLSKKSGKYCFASDDGKYFNHSKTPNALSTYYGNEEEVVTNAIRNIRKGEELTENYSTYVENFKEDW